MPIDAYVEALLAATDGAAIPLHRAADPELVRAADLLHRHLGRAHPSFRFEEALSRRLNARALEALHESGDDRRGEGDAAATRGEGGLIVFPVARRRPSPEGEASGRGLLLGGAIASGVSLAGAAVFAWHRARPGGRGTSRPARRLALTSAREILHLTRSVDEQPRERRRPAWLGGLR